jgi:enoyl-CoA hydratase
MSVGFKAGLKTRLYGPKSPKRPAYYYQPSRREHPLDRGASAGDSPETARFGFPELGRHIPPAYAAASAALPEALARELCLTGRLVDAREAVAAGIAARLATREEAVAFAHGVAAQPPAATAAVKRRALAAGEHTWRRALELEEEELRAALLSDP